MRTDIQIKSDVEAELKWDPDIDPTDIGVAVKNGVVTLTGFVRSYSSKYQAEADVKRVSGVVGVANDLKVQLPSEGQRPDPEIARDAVAALKAELPYSSANMKVVVKDGWLSLEGTAEWNYQRTRAEEAVRRDQGHQGRQQPDRAETPRRAVRGQEQDRRGLSPQCGGRRPKHHRRSQRHRGDPEGRGPIMGRAAGG